MNITRPLTKAPLRIVVSGPGLIGRKHIALLRESSRTELAGIVAPDREAHSTFASEQGVPHYLSVDEALEATAVDGVIISSPNAAHLEQTLTAIDRRIPTLVEKPLTSSLADAKSIVDASERSGVAVLVGHHRTYSPLLTLAREFISSPDFGTPVAAQGSALFYKPDDYYAAGPWRTRKGGGPILINLIHEIGILRLLFGEIESVSAKTSRAQRRFEVEDTAAVVFTFANGALGTFLLSDTTASSKSWEMTAGENPAYPFFPEQDCYHFAGTMGSLDFPSMNSRTYVGAEARTWWGAFEERRLVVTRTDPLRLQLDHFVDVIQGKLPPLVSARDGYLNMVVLEAIIKSGENGCAVPISDVIL